MIKENTINYRGSFSGTRNEAAMHIEDALVLLRLLTQDTPPAISAYAELDNPAEWASIIETAEDALEFLER